MVFAPVEEDKIQRSQHMKKHFHLFAMATALVLMVACNKKDKDEEMTDPTEETTTTTTQSDDGSSVTIEAGKNGGKVEVESEDGTDVKVDIDKKGGSIKVSDSSSKVNVKLKDDGKKE